MKRAASGVGGVMEIIPSANRVRPSDIGRNTTLGRRNVASDELTSAVPAFDATRLRLRGGRVAEHWRLTDEGRHAPRDERRYFFASSASMEATTPGSSG